MDGDVTFLIEVTNLDPSVTDIEAVNVSNELLHRAKQIARRIEDRVQQALEPENSQSSSSPSKQRFGFTSGS